MNNIEKDECMETSTPIKYTSGWKEFFQQNLYGEISGTSLFFIAVLASIVTYFFKYNAIPQGDLLFISILVAETVFIWINWIGGVSLIINFYMIVKNKMYLRQENFEVRGNCKKIIIKNEESENSFENRYIGSVLSTWNSYIFKIDSNPRLVIPKAQCDKRKLDELLEVTGLKSKYKSSFILIAIVLLYLVSAGYYLSMKDYKYYYLNSSVNNFNVKYDDSTMFVQLHSGGQLDYDQYKNDCNYRDNEVDPTPTGYFNETTLWVFQNGEAKNLGILEGSFNIFKYKKDIYLFSYAKEKDVAYRWDKKNLAMVKDEKIQKTLEARRKKLRNHTAEEAENDFEQMESVYGYSVAGDREESGEKAIDVGKEKLVIRVSKPKNRNESGVYILKVKNLNNNVETELMKKSVGREQISKEAYFGFAKKYKESMR